MWGSLSLSDDRTGLPFIIVAGPRQQSFSGPSSVGLVTIFYSLRFETSLFVASYDAQGYGRGIRPRSHTGQKLPVIVFFSLYSLRSDNTEITSIA
jgi:hypothetical protein